MTCIAADARAGVMVSDSGAADEEMWCPITKIYRVGDALIGFAGCLGDRDKWLAWNNGGRIGRFPRMKKRDGFSAVILRPSGVYELSDDGHELLIERGFHAVGSGAHAAVAAMILGFDPFVAVSVACQIDPNSRGDIQSCLLTEEAL